MGGQLASDDAPCLCEPAPVLGALALRHSAMLRAATEGKVSPSKTARTPNTPSHRRNALSSIASKTGSRSRRRIDDLQHLGGHSLLLFKRLVASGFARGKFLTLGKLLFEMDYSLLGVG
jgi:hypothetical protein